ncbi:uncharacterized protein LOC112049636 [Bicyclus anynana]|uniref:Uncharacterized protein LOC112049636 n=1 Tax=Bicyclus anynana TaxID=110368 RepID=A0A6J1NEG9_BICAN|nr:uncharacterized protein LOC112049636 [Bicyclus anynana]XP_052739253.1 uncharacterized protein LOC112049636 [Bicyclus anynana]XP_052739254.1 uncharacterized protein LOC112049636 [Bicyclus anynana]
MPWQRPADVPVGRVWSRFKGRERDGAPPVMYQIRDMEESYRKTCLDMMQETFIRDEPICHALGIASDPESIQTIRNNWEEYVSQKISLACFTEVNGEPRDLVGFNILLVKCKDEPEEDISKVKGESWRKCLKAIVYSEKLVDVFEYYGVDKYFTSSGLTVLPEHRGQNIGARLIDARKELSKAFGIKAACTVFTATTSQVLAAKCNYQVIATMPYADLLQHGVDLSNCSTKEAKVMGIRFE